MPTDLEQQLARYAEALDREAPAIPFDDMVSRGTVAVDVDLLERQTSDRASRGNGVSWIDSTRSHDESDEDDVVIELAPPVAARRPAWRRVALKAALAVAAVAVLVVTVAAIERGGDELDPADDLPSVTTTFVSPRNGFAVGYPVRGDATVTPAKQLLGVSEQVDDGYDVVETGLAAVFKGASTTRFPPGVFGLEEEDGSHVGRQGSIDEQVDEFLSVDTVLPGGCGVPRSQQAEITIDGQSGRIAECPKHIEATVVVGGRLYLFTLGHDRSDARAVFDAFVATIDLTPETAVDFPGLTSSFVSPTYGYSFQYYDRGGLAPATELWDPVNPPLDRFEFDGRFDGVETGLGAYFVGVSTAIPEGVSIDAWVDEYGAPGGCGVPRSEQAEITIDGQSGRIAECRTAPETGAIEATVVAGGRLYLFTLGHDRSDARAWFDAWVATIDLTPEDREVIARKGGVGIVMVVLVLAAACGSDAGTASPTSTTSATSTPAADFPIATFAGISEDPVTEELAAELQAALALHDVADGGGMSATVMTADGTWSGTTGTADGVRDLQVDDQLAIASITKSVVAAQVMLMVEAGELALDDLVADHLPGDLQFDTNEATIRDLLGHRSGLPDYYDLLNSSQETEPQRVWTPTEILELLPAERTPPASTFAYAETNYLLLSLVIEQLRGRPLAGVLRDGALAIDGLERLVHQPDERPTEPMAMPAGASKAVLESGGGYLPSLANATAYSASGAIASDSPSLARWWRALCAGEIVSQASLTEMAKFEPAAHLGSYGLGVYNPALGYAQAFGHTGQMPGYMTWAACLPEDEAVIVVLSNHEVDDGHLAWSHGLARPLVDVLRSR